MKINLVNKLHYVFLSALLIGLSACENDDVEDVVIDGNQPTLTVTSSTGSFNFNEVENDQVITLTATLDKPTNKQVRVYIFQESGTADGNDISLPATGYINIPAYQTSATGTITIHKDIVIEDTETAVINIGDSRTTAAFYQPFQMNITIQNFSNENATMLLEWDDDNLDDHLCDMDFDVYLDTFEAYAFTGDCPENLFEPSNPNNLWTGELTEGTHNIMVDLWDTNGFMPDPAITIPLRLTFGKLGSFAAFLDLNGLYTSESEDSNNGAGGVMMVGSVEVVNGLYTVYDRNGVLIAQESN
ncbi:hypothetical protein [Hanstruepera ponticola]|uniref:hypothetical protein n=1 Tax=Hanstruepera ponticola TaxID=2042995 RepID=UPI0013C4EDE2|nr:hypothetical protein [Hanstruepera ponticola]